MSSKVTSLNQKVKNVSGSSKDRGNWLQSFYAEGDSNAETCIIKGCGNLATAGGHLYHDYDITRVYIAPICDTCNHPSNTDWMEVKAHRLMMKR
ncbi:hypothetical protein [Entomospira culicis]|uniref:Uncharacterized protein n=1 Tax=Entomospira culicis TaxID=2719989 RepID=A0A968GI96_9SPIO|nr:hypothetical protein [Entomospira culicis]NIZ18920.1 hypothetical protein [Entomospira culicis]NIZ69135.1 hypothetical protein [Entomospira culicis]WDI37721.1 hypothetical protein PVA46_02755 [Entomospira culicis]WDI39349.1 hypothetical protein PVA47_02760 [Entomospira culicis]